MEIDVEAVENAFEWESFEDGKPYLGTYRQQIPSMSCTKKQASNAIKKHPAAF